MTSSLLHLMRDGAPVQPGLLLGQTDRAATPAGISECVEQAQGLHFERLITSPLQRARSAAEQIGEACALPAIVDTRWSEIHFGDWDGVPTRDVDTQALAEYWDDPEINVPPRGERWSELRERVDAGIADLEDKPTLILTHGGPMRAALASLCGFDIRQIWAFDLPYAALLSLRVWRGERPSAQIIGLSP